MAGDPMNQLLDAPRYLPGHEKACFDCPGGESDAGVRLLTEHPAGGITGLSSVILQGQTSTHGMEPSSVAAD